MGNGKDNEILTKAEEGKGENRKDRYSGYQIKEGMEKEREKEEYKYWKRKKEEGREEEKRG